MSLEYKANHSVHTVWVLEPQCLDLQGPPLEGGHLRLETPALLPLSLGFRCATSKSRKERCRWGCHSKEALEVSSWPEHRQAGEHQQFMLAVS